ncbi:alpha/beta fold hydrolase [Pseudonocardia sp. GCM10023141]|uniref:alpha/beta fold hydrolase n=1 Tax=Pseudonocardia sp. GCM10023141 TaxID=3252653 RepID=UPI00360AD293
MSTTHDRLVSVPGSTLPCRSYGDPANPALILLMGNTMPGGFWPPQFCAGLAATGLHVTEYDYRDVGGSTPGAFAQQPYDLLDLADDVCAVADALGRERVHLAGLSMGGFLSLLTALRHPDRVASVTSMMSTADYTVLLAATLHGREPRNPTFPAPRADWLAAVAAVPVDQPYPQLLAAAFRLAGGSRGDGDEAYWLAEIARVTDSPETTLAFDHKLAADRTDPAWLDLAPRLGELAVPVQVIQGADDPIFPPPTGRLTVDAIPHATLHTVDGMGHMLEPAFFAPLTEALAAHIARAIRETAKG